MHRIALRSLHLQPSIHRRIWPIQATQATWHLQRQPFAFNRRQFHVSLPKQADTGVSTALAESIRPIDSSVLESIPSPHITCIVLALTIIIPHYIRYRLQVRDIKKEMKQFEPARPLDVVYDGARNRRLRALSGRGSTGITTEDMIAIDQKAIEFGDRINAKYALQYSTWKTQTLLRPALHIAWTGFCVAAIPPDLAATYIDVSALCQNYSLNSGLVHLSGVLFLYGSFLEYLTNSRFWQAFPSKFVDQMPPNLQLIYGLGNDAKPGPVNSTVTPKWHWELRQYFTKSLEWESNMSRPAIPDGTTVARILPSMITWGTWVTLTLYFVSAVTLPQGIYLLTAGYASRIRQYAYSRQVRKLARKQFDDQCKWVPLTPRF